jgi:hypothetical protein
VRFNDLTVAASMDMSSGIFPCVALIMEAAGTSETSVHFCQTTRRNMQDYSHLLDKRMFNRRTWIEYV